MPSRPSARWTWVSESTISRSQRFAQRRIRVAHASPWGQPAAPSLDRLEHQQLGAVQVADDRHVRRDPRGRLVDRREVVEVQDVGLARARVRERPRPGADLALEGGVVEAGEDLVGRARAVLVGGVHRRIGAPAGPAPRARA